MALTCVVKGCSNSSRKLKKWKEEECSIHKIARQNEACSCDPPFRLYPFPTEKKDSEGRKIWIKMINRYAKDSTTFWEPSKDSRVCSLHFKDDMPSKENPYPSVNMGYKFAEKRADFLSPPGTKRKRSMTSKVKEKTVPKQNSKRKTPFAHKIKNVDLPSSSRSIDNISSEETDFIDNISSEEYVNMIDNISSEETDVTSRSLTVTELTMFLISLISVLYAALLRIAELEKQIKYLEHQQSRPLHQKILNDKTCNHFTNLANVKIFDILHDKIYPLVRKRFTPTNQDTSKRKFLHTPKKSGPERKLSPKDEFLLTLMKLRLNLQTLDLATRFSISEGTCSSIFHCWLRAMAEYFRHLIYVPDIDILLGTTPQRFRKFKNLVGIIDCSELFIETPKNLEMQSSTWSEYKHHNTVKFLICVAPNSAIIFMSKAFTGRISDKKITIDSKFLDHVPPQCSIMADKGFNIIEECSARNIYFIVPPGKRGASQMTPAEVKKTSDIAKVRILVEQVIRRLKTFRILASEMSISMLENVDDILTVCAAICNFKEPLYKD